MALIASDPVPLDSANVRKVSGDDWTGISDQKRRKQLQNRLNQRAYKERIRQAKLARAFGQSKKSQYPVISRPEDGRLQVTTRGRSPGAMCPAYPLLCHPDVLVDPVVREVILFARDTLWPTFSSARRYLGSDPSLNEIWFHRILNVPIMRNAAIIGTCMDIELLTGRRYPSTISKTIIELSREVRGLISQLPLESHRHIGAELPQSRPIHSSTVNHGGFSAIVVAGPTSVDDDLLFAVMHLVKASTTNLPSGVPLNPFDISAGTFGLFTPPLFLQRLQALHLWGRSCPYQIQGKALDAQADRHLAALEYLVSLKGGLRNIKTPGFAEALHLFDVMESAKRLTRPKFELPEQSIRLSKHLERLRHGSPRRLGLCELGSLLRGSSLLETLEDLRILCSWVSAVLDSPHQDARAGPQGVASFSMHSIEDLTTLRNLTEYCLLTFLPDPGSSVEVLVHTAALIFMHGVVFPLPNRWPMEMLIQRLIDGFQYLQLHLRDLEERRFLVWVFMMGAMATSDADVQRLFFVERLAVLAGRMGISSWSDVKEILEGYLWVNWGCDAGGMDIWRMVFEWQINPVRTDVWRTS